MQLRIIIGLVLTLFLISSVYSISGIVTPVKSFYFDHIEDPKQEVTTTIQEIKGQTLRTLEVTIDEHPLSSTTGGYKWDLVLCDLTGDIDAMYYLEEDNQGGFNFSTPINKNKVTLSDYGINNGWCSAQNGTGFVLFSSGSKNQFPVKFRLELPNNAQKFKIYAGTASDETQGGSLINEFNYQLNNGESTNISYYFNLNGTLVPYEDIVYGSYFNGWIFNETQINDSFNSLNSTFDGHIYQKIVSNMNYKKSPTNPYVLSYTLPIGKERYLSFEKPFKKENNLYEYVNKTVYTCINFTGFNLSCSEYGYLNVTRKITRNIDFNLFQINDTWYADFYNILDLDPSFSDSTDSNFTSGTLINMTTEGTGISANLTSNSTRGGFESQIFSYGAVVNWTNISVSTSAMYGQEVGRGNGDTNNANIPSINTSGLVFLYHFNNETAYGENATKIYDFSRLINSQKSIEDNATLTQSHITSQDYVLGGGALELQGVYNSHGLGSDSWNDGGLNEFAFSGWVKENKFSGNQYIYQAGSTFLNDAIFLRIDGPTGYLIGGNVDTDLGQIYIYQTPGDFKINEWTHVVFMWTGGSSPGSLKLYVNGENTSVTGGSSGSFDGNIADSSAQWEIGKAGGGGFFNGTLDEYMFFNRTLSEAEIKNLYRRGAAKLNLSYRTCNDAACAGETYSLYHNLSWLNGVVQLNGSTNNQYFQYKFNYTTRNQSIGKLHVEDVTVDFETLPSQWENGTSINMTVEGIGNASNLTSNSTTGGFESQIFDAGATVTWTNISDIQEAMYNQEIGRANGDTNDAILPSFNTSGMFLSFLMNNETAYGESDTNVYDFSTEFNSDRSSVLANNGTISGNVGYNYSNSIHGAAAMQFGGANGDQITISNDPSMFKMNQLSISVWLKYEGTTSSDEYNIVDAWNTGDLNYLMRFDDGASVNKIEFYVYDGAATGNAFSATDLSDQQWHHVAAVYNGSIMRVYKDTLLSATTVSASGTIGQLATPLTDVAIGGQLAGTTDDWIGKIDEVTLFNRSLSAEEIRTLYLRGIAKLNLSYRTCNDALCSGESYSLYHNLSWQNGLVSLNGSTDNRYFQYKFNYTTLNATLGPVRIEDVNIGYASIGNASDSCTYSSGNHVYECSDNCVISSPVDFGGNNWVMTGGGTFTGITFLKNWVNGAIIGGCYVR